MGIRTRLQGFETAFYLVRQHYRQRRNRMPTLSRLGQQLHLERHDQPRGCQVEHTGHTYTYMPNR